MDFQGSTEQCLAAAEMWDLKGHMLHRRCLVAKDLDRVVPT